MLTTKDGRLLVYHISLWRLGHLVLGDRRAAHRAVAEAAMNVTIARRAGGDSTFGRNASLSVSGAEDFLDAGGGGSGVAVLTNLTANVDIGQSLALYKARMQVAVVGADGRTLPVAEETSATSRPVPATSIALYTSGGVQHVITGTADGHLCIWNADAQLLDVHAPRPSALARLSATSEPGPLVPQYAVTALAKGSSTIAYAMTNVIGFFALSRGSFQPFVCRATGNITSMQYDLQSKTLLWAATSAGDVLVFHTRHRKAKGSSMPECRLLHRVFTGVEPSGSAPQVGLFRGYALVLAGGSVHTFNTTRLSSSSPQLAFVSQQLTEHSNMTTPLLVATSGPGREAHTVDSRLVVYNPAGGNASIFEALLPYHRAAPGADFSWIRVPAIFLAVVAFVLYQVYKGKRSEGFDHGTTVRAMAGMLRRDPGGFPSRAEGLAGTKEEVDALLARLARTAGGSSAQDVPHISPDVIAGFAAGGTGGDRAAGALGGSFARGLSPSSLARYNPDLD